MIGFANNMQKIRSSYMNAQLKKIQKKANALFEEAHFIAEIKNKKDYTEALNIMDELVEDYDANRLLIEILSITIEKWENSAREFKDFNKSISDSDDAEAVLSVIMEQHNLGVNDFPEIGSKSLLSKIINRKRKLTREHIKLLCDRFNLDPAIFF